MKFFSIKQFLHDVGIAVKRFPITLAVSIIGSAAAMLLISNRYYDDPMQHYLINILLTSVMALPLSIGLHLFMQKHLLLILSKSILVVVVLGLLCLFGFSLPYPVTGSDGIRIAVYTFAFHAMISFIPWLERNLQNGFWQFNRILFTRLLTSILFSGTLYIGLALALAAVDHLFGAEIDEKSYLYLWVFMAGVVNTLIFVAGIPEMIFDLHARTDYPKGLKIFTQFVLLPIVSVYLIILYLYFAKIVVMWEWPVGWVSNLILSFSVLGIFSLLLVFPVRLEEKNKWILIFSKVFYFAVLPLIFLLFLAIFRRISEYGITEGRYYVLILALWLLGAVVYLIRSKYKKIKFIPVSLFLVALFSSFGPWGAFSVSKNSQLGRFETILEKNGMLLENGKAEKNKVELTFEDQKNLSSIVDYLVQMHGYRALSEYFPENFDTAFGNTVYSNVSDIMKLLGVEYINEWQAENSSSDYYYIQANNSVVSGIQIDPFSTMIQYSRYHYAGEDDSVYVDNVVVDSLTYSIEWRTIDNNLSLFLPQDTILVVDFDEITSRIRKQNKLSDYYLSKDSLSFDYMYNNRISKIVLNRLNGYYSEERNEITEISCDFLLSARNDSL